MIPGTAFEQERHLVNLFDRGSCAGAIAPAISLLWLAAATLHAESRLQIVAPENGVVLGAGGALTVTIKAPPSAFQSVSVAGDGPFALSTGLSAPPYEYSYPIPADIASGRYRLKAVGATASGETVCSDPIEVDIERAGKPKKLQSEWQSVTLAEQEDTPLQVWGVFADGSKIDVTRSTRATYTSDRPTVAAVTSEGGVSGVAAGKARITVKYDDKIVVVPVVVTPNPAAAAKEARR
jgi:hypothetical protein